MKKYLNLSSHVFTGILRRRSELIREQVIALILFLILFLLLDLTSTMSKEQQALLLEYSTFLNPPSIFFIVLSFFFLIASIGLGFYLLYYYLLYISKMRMLYKENLLSRYQQVFDESYVLAEFFGIIFFPILLSFFSAMLLSYLLNPVIIGKIAESGYIFERVSYQLNIFRDFLLLFVFIGFILIQFFIQRYRKHFFKA